VLPFAWLALAGTCPGRTGDTDKPITSCLGRYPTCQSTLPFFPTLLCFQLCRSPHTRYYQLRCFLIALISVSIYYCRLPGSMDVDMSSGSGTPQVQPQAQHQQQQGESQISSTPAPPASITSTSTSAGGVSFRRQRASRACETCHARKVRCDAASLGVPCTNCVAFQIECRIPNPKRKKTQGSGSQTNKDSDRYGNALMCARGF
jgi:hypothetical protein